VVWLDDDALDLTAASTSRELAGDGLVGEAALLAAVTANRTGRMRDVVETIQAEQDEAVRAGLAGVLVVQGGPGTGKTAVALHRAAYLLYTHRERLAKRGVLIVGPNATFLQYISHVLPALGETGAVLCTLGELYPGVVTRRVESRRVAEIKGRLAMADVVAAAVRDRQRVPDDAVDIVADGHTYRLDRDTCLKARESARRADEHHNVARPVFVARMLDALAEQAVTRLNEDPFDELTRKMAADIARELGESGEDLDDAPLLNIKDQAELREDLADEPAVLAVLDWLWPELTPRQLLADLFTSPDLLDEAAPQLAEEERTALLREPGDDWSVSDVPLLDEAAELLGRSEADEEAQTALRHRQQVAYAQGVLEVLE
jgi:DNA helicase IV